MAVVTKAVSARDGKGAREVLREGPSSMPRITQVVRSSCYPGVFSKVPSLPEVHSPYVVTLCCLWTVASARRLRREQRPCPSLSWHAPLVPVEATGAFFRSVLVVCALGRPLTMQAIEQPLEKEDQVRATVPRARPRSEMLPQGWVICYRFCVALFFTHAYFWPVSQC